MLRDTANNESIIVEYGFVDSGKDDPSQIKNNYKKYAEAVVRAVMDYLKLPYTSNSTDTYIVKKGDTLWDLARKFNTSVTELKRINNLSTNNLKIGQILKITPSFSNKGVKDNEFIEYIVKPGDNLNNISNKFDVSVNEIKNVNNLSTDLIKVGQKLKIPNNLIKYIVVKGDNLYDISRKYNTTVSTIKKINNLDNTFLQIGDELLIPKN